MQSKSSIAGRSVQDLKKSVFCRKTDFWRPDKLFTKGAALIHISFTIQIYADIGNIEWVYSKSIEVILREGNDGKLVLRSAPPGGPLGAQLILNTPI